MADGIHLLIGTTKGAFILRGDARRTTWDLTGPHCDGWPINHVIGEVNDGTLWAAGGNGWSGAGVWRSRDGGSSWELIKLANGESDTWLAENPEIAAQIGATPSGPAPFTGEMEAIWSLSRANGTLYAGAKPAHLYASEDDGDSWARVEGLASHPSRNGWMPGGAGLTLHSIVTDPDSPGRLWIGISAAGVFATEDGGATWERRNRRSNRAAADGPGLPGHDPSEVGACVHNLQRAAQAPGDLLYQQNHHGTFRSADGGRSWHDITAGLPSSFGFPVAVHPHDPQTLWVLPLNGDSIGRYPPDAAAAVWRSRDGGENWQALRDGLPRRNCFFTVLRQAMATDRDRTVGVYFGTNSGSIFASRDEGDSWEEIASHLPTVLSVECIGPWDPGRVQ
ncbi:hypothetical protein SAMN05444007_10631 [Cribrihabitans marinus]|uniref:BNR/Asp-box repeat-containing protein n=1 Tax=Cribrihabitans marinus TaxID=1227549 RepID=A0A1H7AUC0_9RHOB|nr:sialidase family protein [Cribrihabitans marinus]GGH31708.1 hypothetical protein GCM10010973_22670 [Cribrihabitans marinus]SEJ64635.1 hypothetical protein SAMN05444007_10631 [Cribrihabitans marinus]